MGKFLLLSCSGDNGGGIKTFERFARKKESLIAALLKSQRVIGELPNRKSLLPSNMSFTKNIVT
jgi:hypothetical protein